MPPSHVFSMICAPEIEEKLLDLLLIHLGNEVFLSMPSFSHGTDPRQLSALERVLGRKRSVYVQVLVTADEAQELRRLLHKTFDGAGVRYWTTAITLEGETT